MLLKELIKKINFDFKVYNYDENVKVEDICNNSKIIKENDIFVCIKGKNFDSHLYVKDNKEIKASVIVSEYRLDTNLPNIVVQDSRRILGYLCKILYKIDYKKIKLIGITGTNGKTTTAHIVYHILNSLNIKTGIIGTEGSKLIDKNYSTTLTTPDTICLQKTIKDMVNNDAEVIVMEVSAHASFYYRAIGIDFEIMALTNITQDHLDFFGNMEEYASSKAKLFTKEYTKKSIINIDNKYCKNIFEGIDGKKVSISTLYDANYMAKDIIYNQDKTIADLIINKQNKKIVTKKIGKFNFENILLAITIILELNFDKNLVFDIVEKNEFFVSGRMNFYKLNNGSVAVIDYAHTPDGIQKILECLNRIKKKNLITVFGAGGDRDNSKRALMGEVASNLSDFCVITSDNPRYENEENIIKEIISGIKNDKFVQIIDRKKAIIYAIEKSQDGDIIAILGKGAEGYIDKQGIKLKYSDQNTISNFIKEL